MSTVVKHKSENVIINAPMSFAGATQRSSRLAGKLSGWEPRWLALTVAWSLLVGPLLLVWWGAIIIWYVVFGIFLVPYRLLRRGARKRKKEALQHREAMAALEAQQKSALPPA